jgi:hypothetical protein
MKLAASRSFISGWNRFLRLPIGSPRLKHGSPLSTIRFTVVIIPFMCLLAAKYPFTHNLKEQKKKGKSGIMSEAKYNKTILKKLWHIIFLI